VASRVLLSLLPTILVAHHLGAFTEGQSSLSSTVCGELSCTLDIAELVTNNAKSLLLAERRRHSAQTGHCQSATIDRDYLKFNLLKLKKNQQQIGLCAATRVQPSNCSRSNVRRLAL